MIAMSVLLIMVNGLTVAAEMSKESVWCGIKKVDSLFSRIS